MSTGAWVAVAAVVVAVLVGLLRSATDGRFRSRRRRSQPGESSVPSPAVRVLTGAGYLAQLGERATLVQFSSPFCAPCRSTSRVLAGIAETVPGVAHVELDVTEEMELVRELGILRTPTTIVLDGSGTELARAAGAVGAGAVMGVVDRIG